MEITITLTEVESKALAHVAYDPTEWVENFTKTRCRAAIEDIFQAELGRITSTGGTISGTKEDIVLAADIKTAKQLTDEANLAEPLPMSQL